MYKPASLRRFLTSAIPELARDPDRLTIYITNGAAHATMAPGLSWEYQYTLEIFLTDFAGDPDTVIAPVVAWMRINQPDVMANPNMADRAISFDADILNNDTVDLSITLNLTERVICKPRTTGPGHDISHPAEPQFEPRLETPKHWQLYVNDNLVAEWDQAET